MLLPKSTQSFLMEWDLLQAIGILTLLTPILAFVYIVIKNRYLHPLKHFPGPFLASISPIYSFWAATTEKEHLIIEKLHKKYGPIVRYQPDFLLFADPKMIPVIYHRHADKTEFNRAKMVGEVSSVVITIDHRKHAVKRRRIANPYSMSAARAMESMIDARIVELKEKLTKLFAETRNKMDFVQWSQFFAYDGKTPNLFIAIIYRIISGIGNWPRLGTSKSTRNRYPVNNDFPERVVISEIAFGKVFGFMESASDVGALIKSFHTGIKALTLIAHWDALREIVRHDFVQRWLIPNLDEKIGIGRLRSERDELLNKRLSLGLKPGERVDLMQHFLNSKNPDGSPMPLADVKAELLLVMAAGSDTTAATLRGLLLNILQNEGCYEKLTAEIDGFVNSKNSEFSVVSFDEAQSLKYLTACIKESMRFSPSTPILLPRATPKGGLTLDDGRYIPEDTKLSANAHVTQRNKEVYGEDAEMFNPSRWLEDESKNNTMEKYDLHFGSSSRACLGKNIAMLELWKASFEFFRTFKPTLVEPESIKFRNVGVLVHQDLWITIEKRG